MYINKKEILNTKFIVPKADSRAVQKVLFNCGYGFELALDKSFVFRKFKDETAFFVDLSGFIEVIEREGLDDTDFYAEFKRQPEDEIKWEALF